MVHSIAAACSSLINWKKRSIVTKSGPSSPSPSVNDKSKKKVCAAKGVKRFFAYLPGDGVGPDDPYLRFIEIASDPANHPILVHCSAAFSEPAERSRFTGP